MRSLAPTGVREGAVRHSPAPTREVDGAVPRGGGGGLLPCGQRLVRVFPALSTLALEFLQRPVFGDGRGGFVRGAHLVHETVRSELGRVLDYGQGMPYDRSATTLYSPSSLEDLDARRLHWSIVFCTSRPIVPVAEFERSVQVVPRGSPAWPIWSQTARELRR